MKLKNEKKIIEELEKFSKSLKKAVSDSNSPLEKVEAGMEAFRKLADAGALAELVGAGAGSIVDEIHTLLESYRELDSHEKLASSRVEALEREMSKLSHSTELLQKNLQMLNAENRTLEERRKKLEDVLRFTKEEIGKLREEVQKLKAPPLPYGIFLKRSQDPEYCVISVDGRKYEVNVASDKIKIEDLKPGQMVLLNPAYNIIDLREFKQLGEVATIIDTMDKDRFIIKTRESDERVARRSDVLQKVKIKVGDRVLFDPYSELIYEQLPKTGVGEVVLEEIPQVSYDDIGGLEEQIEQIKDAVELPYIYGHLYSLFQLKPPKGILLYGPPGCGKTLVAKAVARNLALRIQKLLEEQRQAIELYKHVIDEKVDMKHILEDYEKFKNLFYAYHSIYWTKKAEKIDDLYEQLDKSGILGDFIRRTEGQKEKDLVSVQRLEDWLDLKIELKEKGFGTLDETRIGEMLEHKRKNYYMKRKKLGDRDYIRRWLEDYLKNNNIDIKNLDAELQKISERLGTGVESYFLNIKGPELLNKYVGETEYRIREVFIKARDKASYGFPVIVFFDEMESIFRTRGSGISSDIESTIVPQFLTEIDGVESLNNVIVIGASNRQDLIDPAVLRPGRLDIKIRIERPNKDAARDIFTKYMKAELPFDEELLKSHNHDRQKCVNEMIDRAVEEMYSTKDENRFLKVIYQSQEEEVLYFKDFSSGAMIQAIVSRAKTYALKRMIISGRKGMRMEDIIDAIRDEYKENEDLPNTTNPDDWSRISGKKGERIISIETLMPERVKKPVKETEEISVSSRYL
jgi:ATP-dependent 26S proteasome regulatory subunit